MPAVVNIYHGAFRDEDVNKQVFSYMDWTNLDSQILDRAFEMFNAPHEALEEDEVKIMEQYRKKGLRSLSEGDVVEVDDVKYICQAIGWKKKEINEVAEEKARVEKLRESMLVEIDKMVAKEKARMRNTGSSQ